MSDTYHHTEKEKAATTVSFLWFAGLALVLVFAVVTLTELQQLKFPVPEIITESPQNKIDTSGWHVYADSVSGLRFSYPENWRVEKVEINQTDYLLKVSPQDEVQTPGLPRIIVSTQDYFGLAGLNSQEISIDGLKGIQIDENLFGVKAGKYFVTFDGGYKKETSSYFQALRHTVQF